MRSRAGFTLIELMLVVVVIGVLASIAVPRFRDLARASKEAEAEPMLRQILTLEERHRAKDGSYTLNINALEGGATLAAGGEYYTYSVAAHASGLCIVATPTAAAAALGIQARSLDGDRRFHQTGQC